MKSILNSQYLPYLFCENTMNSLSFPFNFYDITVCFANSRSFWRIYNEFTWIFVIHYGFSRNHYEFTICLANLLPNHEFTIFYANSLQSSVFIANLIRIYVTLRGYTMNYLFFEFKINSTSFSRIHYLFRHSKINKLSVS